ncbi:hypothetical protein XM38_045220 [Halomicronema hongdechloris C2206]|uniref:N-acetyltransferase domain-containing protein n=1 Tax=Halomicronema hongdechloris C2206 TaxID=1641165 RepID=A0A1Z3HTB8_9CYAN|nr:GNAT family N-acetyltransferase [Halomicronema hongdechloris]ASC73553.1 hypothetical protein XM38_045220 [Halomicronema hongdechloris C2206]
MTPDGSVTPRMTYRVRAARPEDIDQLTELLVTSFYPPTGWLRWAYPILRLSISEELRHRLRSPKSPYVCLTAISGDSNLPSGSDILVGTVELSRRSHWPWQIPQYGQLYVSNLAVGLRYRRRGIALRLLGACETVARDWGFDHLYLHVMEDNRDAQQLYYKAGFLLQQAESTPLSALGLQPRRLLLSKSLGSSSLAA